ncbi:hypothetical protein SAMN04487785_12613 [Dyella jiangningensis]|uniref:hypothetical protein n=1 Tax=Dyella sp. AtDHG13 TaxID=1938897 RepID=UPI000890F6E9|nr:hypothetical protein [Dyella sp. AtDHG13]PXV52103.1 hypothetical protein BDW41_12120 [Dyella sp. AtDHG13]SDL55343.1 hypothetical protein SAMN04487785_12613 [Dyella jiangningensis]
MSAYAQVSPPHRERVLRALGVTPWVRRAAVQELPATESPVAEIPTPVASGDCVVVLPAGCSPRELDLVGRALMACGPRVARAPRIEVANGQLANPPEARAYLVFGEAQAHALGRELPAAVVSGAHIVLADEPSAVLTSGAGKRRLWNALRSLRRALATSAE